MGVGLDLYHSRVRIPEHEIADHSVLESTVLYSSSTFGVSTQACNYALQQ